MAEILSVSAFIAFLMWVRWVLKKEKAQKDLENTILDLCSDLTEVIEKFFLVQSCTRCHESLMRLWQISPNARSIEYKCDHCGKKARAGAGSPNAKGALHIDAKIRKALQVYSKKYHKNWKLCVNFQTPENPLSYEQSVREPIPSHMRSEVWRRDMGKCVSCGSKGNLQFDHIIPISKGGATTAVNLQILCRACNLSKSNKI